VEWLKPSTGVRVAGEEVEGSAVRTLSPPFAGDAELHLKMKCR
jgi:hypothetical protein